jgi:HEAT repeat protein
MGEIEVRKLIKELEKEKDVEELIRGFENEDNYVRLLVIEALANIGEPAVEPLIQALKSQDALVRQGAAEALGEIGDARAVKPLTKTRNDLELFVRMTASMALARIKEKTS